MSDLTILIPTFNQAAFLPDLFSSIIASDIGIDLIISDDASKDQTRQVLNEFFPKLKTKCRSVTSIIHHTNLGGNGRGNYKYLFSLPVETKYLTVLEGDDYLKPESISKRIKYLEDNDMDAVHTDVCVVHEDGSLKCDSWWRDNGCFISNPMTLESQIANNRIFTCTLVAKTDLYKKAYNADLFTDFNIFLGDYACTNRLVKLSNKIGYIDEALSCYRWRESSESHRDRDLVVRDTGHVSNLTATGKLFEDLA